MAIRKLRNSIFDIFEIELNVLYFQFSREKQVKQQKFTQSALEFQG